MIARLGGRLEIIARPGGPIDIGDGWTLEPFVAGEEPGTAGFILTGPAAPACRWPADGLCGGVVRIRDPGDGKPVWTVLSEEPLTLEPSIRCACEGQHGYVREGRYVST